MLSLIFFSWFGLLSLCQRVYEHTYANNILSTLLVCVEVFFSFLFVFCTFVFGVVYGVNFTTTKGKAYCDLNSVWVRKKHSKLPLFSRCYKYLDM